jgi:two-component system sensor histidine kinase PhoQ
LLSLKVRFLLTAALILAIFSLSAGWILRESFQVSVRDRAQEQLKLQIFALLSAADYEDNGLSLPDSLTDPRFNQTNSGLFAVVFRDGAAVWKSQSSMLEQIPSVPSTELGEWVLAQTRDQSGKNYYQLSFSVIWEEGDVVLPYTFVVWEWEQPYLAQIRGFEATLWAWLGGLIVAAIVIVFVLLNLGFRPFRLLADELREVESAQKSAIELQYPSEVMPIVNNLNRLIDHERAMRERYKNSLGNLAHSLKTPLAVLKGAEHQSASSASQSETIQQQVARMDEIVSYQLKRAMSAVPQVSAQGAVLLEMYTRMVSVLSKVYVEQNIDYQQDIRPGIRMPWDEGDTLEVLGNLMDNACKYGAGQVLVTGRISQGCLRITVEDNGPGIAPGDEARVLSRGVRRDERVSGQGIGLAVVTDIVTASHGTLQVNRSDLGGAQLLVSVPLQWL